MMLAEYVVQFVCTNPACPAKLFAPPMKYAPENDFQTYEHAEEYAEAIKTMTLPCLAKEAKDSRLINALGRLAYISRSPDTLTCSHCSAVQKVSNLAYVITEKAITG